ncbi:MAG: RNA polymerase sigma factor [Planctomycetales bacterium]|nr:RNA polymerase sigma factor [Planctomycetales bacterium]MCA9170313.1 RNA polymerase sigma factor [Planctomycetales bacterium]
MAPTDKPSKTDASRRLDRDMFAAQFQAAYSRLWVVAAGILGDQAGADDIVQDSALAAWAKRDQFEPGTNFTAWLARFVRWHAFNYARKRAGRGTHPTSPTDLDQNASRNLDSPRSLEVDRRGMIDDHQPDFDDDIVRALRGMNEMSRSCLLLRTLHDLSYREISELLEIPEGTAMSHVHRSRQFMRDRLQHRESSAFPEDA